MTEPHFIEVDRIAKRMCEASGGTWDRKRTKRAIWRARAEKFIESQKKPDTPWGRFLRWIGL